MYFDAMLCCGSDGRGIVVHRHGQFRWKVGGKGHPPSPPPLIGMGVLPGSRKRNDIYLG